MRKWSQFKTFGQKRRRVFDLIKSKVWWPVSRRVGTFFYWLRTHTYNRYHIISAKSPQNGYKWGWCDRDFVMLCCCFNILKDFVEKERVQPYFGMADVSLEEYIADNSCSSDWVYEHKMLENQYKQDQEIKALYTWWKGGRKAEHDAVDRLYEQVGDMKGEDYLKILNTPRSKQWNTWQEARQALDARDNAMLARLMAVRESLWT